MINDVPAVAGFLVLPKEGRMAWVEWLVSNPDVSKEDRTQGFTEVMNHIDKVARLNGMKMLFSSADKDKLHYKKRLESFGFICTEETITHFLKILTTEDT